jgi:hypothetical protein
MYRGILMRSRLEARFAAVLDIEQATWEYEPRAYADGLVQYLPDFEAITRSGLHTFFEVKPTEEAAYLATDSVLPVFASEPDLTAVIITWPLRGWAGPGDWSCIGVARTGKIAGPF